MSKVAIATSTLGSAGTFDFTSIPATYTHLEVHITGKMSNSGLASYITFNGDNPISGTAYSEINLGYTYSSSAWITSKEYNTAHMYYSYSNTDQYASVITFLDYANTSWYKSILVQQMIYGAYPELMFGGLYKNTAAINRILFSGDTTFQTGTIATLYGVK